MATPRETSSGRSRTSGVCSPSGAMCLPAEQLHVVTVGQPGATAANLWLRVAEVMGVDGNLFDASGRGSNESLGLESAELMLRLNQVSRARGLEWAVYNEMFKHALAKRALSKRRHRESRLRLTERARAVGAGEGSRADPRDRSLGSRGRRRPRRPPASVRCERRRAGGRRATWPSSTQLWTGSSRWPRTVSRTRRRLRSRLDGCGPRMTS